uniref:G protein-coupled receptor n=1 Tax=Steinernema glaseri TaxID=37863 RepID=A0A1I7YUE1_9BILA
MSAEGGSSTVDIAMAKEDDLGVVCVAMLYFAESPTTIGAFATKFSCALLAIAMFVVLLLVKASCPLLPRERSLHPNAYFLLYVHFTFVFIGAVGVLINDGFDLFRLTVFRRQPSNDPDSPDCGIFAMPAAYGAPMRLVTFFGNTGSSTSMLALAVERTVATLRAKSYEQERSRRIAFVLLFVTIALDVAAVVYIVVHINFRRLLPMQSLTAEAADPGTYVLCFCGVLEIFNLLVLVALWLINHTWKHRDNRILATLSQKYQVEENIKTTAILIPLTSLHVLVNIAAYVLMLLGIWSSPTLQEKLKVVITRDTAPIYDLLLPTFTLARILWRRQ